MNTEDTPDVSAMGAYLLFKLEAVKEVLLQYNVFSYCFHRVNCFRSAVLNEKDFAKGTFTDYF